MEPGIIIAALVIIVVIIITKNIAVVQQSRAYVIERLGAFHSIWSVGLHFKIPFIDRIARRVSLKEQVLDYPPQPVITKDNVTMQIDTVVYFQITDPKLYTYGVEQPMAAMETLTSRDIINTKMRAILDEATDPWGIKVNRVELKNILPPHDIQSSMEKQMKAERDRRQAILQAEGQKKSAILIAEGERESAILRADAEKQAAILRAEAEQQAAILKADGEAQAILSIQKALADSLKMLNESAPNDQVTKLKSTYVDGLLKVADEQGFVHTTFKQTGTATGRLSSAEPNLQNIPIRTELGRELRKFFIPTAEGRVLIDADYSQIELRLLADIAGDTAMREAFVSGFDIHTDTASRVFGVDKDHVTVELRKKAKAINFGIMYGMGEHSLSEDLHISRAEAKSYIDSYLSSYPDINRYLDEIIKTAYEQGYVTTKLGRRRFIPELAESNKMRKKFGERVAMNSPIQGTAADIMKIAMIRVHDRLAKSGLDAKLILQVHDELILEASANDAEAAMKLLCEEMENAVKLSVPLDVEAHIGKNWFEAH